MHGDRVRVRVFTSPGIVENAGPVELERSYQHLRLTNQTKTRYPMQTDEMMPPNRNAAHVTKIEWVHDSDRSKRKLEGVTVRIEAVALGRTSQGAAGESSPRPAWELGFALKI